MRFPDKSSRWTFPKIIGHCTWFFEPDTTKSVCKSCKCNCRAWFTSQRLWSSTPSKLRDCYFELLLLKLLLLLLPSPHFSWFFCLSSNTKNHSWKMNDWFSIHYQASDGRWIPEDLEIKCVDENQTRYSLSQIWFRSTPTSNEFSCYPHLDSFIVMYNNPYQ